MWRARARESEDSGTIRNHGEHGHALRQSAGKRVEHSASGQRDEKDGKAERQPDRPDLLALAIPPTVRS